MTLQTSESNHRRRTPLHATAAGQVDHSRSAPCRIGAVCRSQQGRQKLADAVLCLQIAQGNPVWNREIEPCTVIYFSLEDTFNRLQNRIFQLIDGGDAPERLILQTECPSIGQGLEEQVEALVHTYHDVGLIVIDTLQKVRLSDGNGGMYANDYKEAGALKKLADKYGICILLIHHLRKQTASDPFDQISGSTGLMGVAIQAGSCRENA